MRKSGNNIQAAENARNIVLDTKNTPDVLCVWMDKPTQSLKAADRIQFSPDEQEKKIIEAGYRKFPGVKRPQVIISMALEKWAKIEQLEVAS